MLARIGMIGMVLLLVLIGLVMYVCNDRREEHYSRLAAGGDAMARGWLPRWIASDATDIRVLYDLDTNETWGVFKFGEAGSHEVADACKEVLETSVPFPRSRPAKWWPAELVNTSETSAGYRIMKCQERSVDKPGQWETSDAFAAVKSSANAAYFWRVSG